MRILKFIQPFSPRYFPTFSNLSPNFPSRLSYSFLFRDSNQNSNNQGCLISIEGSYSYLSYSGAGHPANEKDAMQGSNGSNNVVPGSGKLNFLSLLLFVQFSQGSLVLLMGFSFFRGSFGFLSRDFEFP